LLKSANSNLMMFTPGIFVKRVVLNVNPEKRIEKRTTRNLEVA
jgi:hypothetical protein